MVTIVRTEGPLALYKGLAPTLIGIAPYAALNFALYDLAKKHLYAGERPQSTLANLAVGGLTGTVAATVCYPLDTVRRRMQMRGHTYSGQMDALRTIWVKVCSLRCNLCERQSALLIVLIAAMELQEGVRGFYLGWTANTLKVVPQNSIRFVSYELLKGLFGIKKAKTDT